jgi:hypothetical protein
MLGRTPLLIAALLAAMGTAASAQPVDAARLKPETEAAWRQYIRETEARREREIAAGQRRAAAPPTQIEVVPMGASGSNTTTAATGDGRIDVPSGLIHHWRGRVFIPGVTLDDVLRYVHTAPRQSDVLASKILEDRGDTLRVYLKLTRTEIITVTYNTEHLVELRRHGPGRASSRSVATKIAELENANQSDEREKPAGDDLGLLWRLNAYWWYEEVPGGVLVECESLSLSRAIPLLLKPFASGTVSRVARESMTRTLDTMRTQLRASGLRRDPVRRQSQRQSAPAPTPASRSGRDSRTAPSSRA